MSRAKTAITFALLTSAAALSACATAPTATEKAAVQAIQAKSIIPASRAERDAADRGDLLSQAKFWGAEYDKNPTDYETALKFARVLRAMGSSQRSSEVSAQALTSKPNDIELTLIYAQAELDQGRPDMAVTPLARAEGAGAGDWRMLSIIGVVMDQMDRSSDAQAYYARALALSPGNAKILSNQALSYALSGQPAKAEQILRGVVDRPDADPRMRQNLVLVLGVQGKFDEAKAAAGPTVPRELVDASQEYFKALLTPARKWDSLRGAQN
jgi:Flp pilus assembly protein TadD